jgi:hypothetical protein
MRHAIESKYMQAEAISAGMVVKAKSPPLWDKWRIVKSVKILPGRKARLELGRTAKRHERVITDTYEWYDNVAYQIDPGGNPTMVELEE